MGNAEGNMKIAKNTVIVYFRIFVTIIVGLVCARIVLNTLGFDDYGLYNVVGSTVAMFGFISAALIGTTQRFINYEMGKPGGDLCRIFNICNVLHILCAIVLFILIEILGTIYINNYLNVIPGKESDAMFVFQVSTIVACVGVMNVPYQSLFVAYEKFSAVAIIDISLYLLKLALVLGMLLFKGNLLRIYAVFMSVSTFLSFAIYHILCKRYWPDVVRWKPVRKASEYREVMSFGGYNILASISGVARSQGSPILVNYFFGTTANAAYGVGNSLFSYIQKIVSNFDYAAAPRITSDISAGNKDSSVKLARTVCRMSVLVMLILFFTLYVELEFLLRLWLGDLPDGAVTFCRWMMVIGIVSSTSGGVGQFISGYGKVKWFMIVSSFLFVMALPIGYFIYKAGGPPVSVLVVYVIVDIIVRLVHFVLLRKIAGIDSLEFIKGAYTRPALVALILLTITFLYGKLGIATAIGRLCGVAVMLMLSCAVVFLVGLRKEEKQRVLEIISAKMRGKRHDAN